MRTLAALLLLMLAGCPSEPCKPGWSTAKTLDRVVLSVAERTPGELYAVGGGLGVAGAKALALRLDGDSWTPLPLERDETLWWVWGGPGDVTDVWMVGELGLVVRWDGTSFTTVASGTQATLFGVWGTSADDVWIVGGMAGTATPDDVLLHWDGVTLAPDATAPARGAALFKVWGTAGEVWVVGEQGTLLHHDAGGWRDDSDATLTERTLTTVSGCAANDVWAVGGNTVLHWDGSSWSQLPEPMLLGSANGVSCNVAGVLIVGNGGLKWRNGQGSGWLDEQFQAPFDTDFHGALVGSDQRFWAAGGNFNAPAAAGPRTGKIAVYQSCP